MAHDEPKPTHTRETPQTPADTSNRARLLHVLNAAKGVALTMDDLRERGIQMPGQMVYELELDGYPVDRVHRRSIVGYRLGAPAAEAREHPKATTDA